MTETATIQKLDRYKTLVLNADFRPLSYHPLSVWPWEQAIKLVYEQVVEPVKYHEGVFARSPTIHMPIPAVVALKQYVPMQDHVPFTKYNVFLRDMFICQYCGENFFGRTSELTFDHVIPKSKGGRTDYTNISTACGKCNSMKENKSCAEAKMWPKVQPYIPSVYELYDKGRKFPQGHLHDTWADFLYWDSEIEP